MFRKIISVMLCLSFLLYVGCMETVNVSRDQFVGERMSGNIQVLTKDHKTYRFAETNYKITKDFLSGQGIMTTGDGAEHPFSGTVAMADVALVQIEQYSGTKTVLLVGGITVGIIAAVLAVGSSKDSPPPPPPPTGRSSCPFVYTYDGTNYHFESETFSGAIFKGLERSNYDNLYHLKPVDGQCRLRLANASNETEYVDEVKLIVADHPAGASIIPDMKGIVHTISQPEPPILCTDFGGKDALSSVLTKDAVRWRSELEGKSFADESDFRDGLVMEFTKPPQAKSAKIVVNGINSRLGFFALENIFKLKGDGKLAWYQKLENDPAERGKFTRWLMREGMLHIKVWENDTWVERGAMLDAGPEIAKDQIALLDVSKITGNTLKIKLEAATDLWRIDCVHVDYSKDVPVWVTEISANSAINEQGTDVRELLSSPDEKYYTTIPGQFVDLTFEDIPRQPGLERSYVVKTRGFYYEWIDAKGPEQTALLERILNEPLYGSKVLMNEWMKNRSKYGELN